MPLVRFGPIESDAGPSPKQAAVSDEWTPGTTRFNASAEFLGHLTG